MTVARRTCLAAVVATTAALLGGVGATPAQAAATPWTLVTPTVPTAPNGAVEAVGCAPDASVCLEVGSYHDATGRQRPLIAQRTGTTWRQTTVSVPPTSAVIELDGVACASATACVAVGRWSTDPDVLTTSADRPVAYTWDGSTWTRTDLTLPVRARSARLAAVSCGSTTSCVAVGSTDPRGGGTTSLAYGFDGTRWTNLAVPSGSAGSHPFDALQAVSCPAARSCTAVGSGPDPAGLILTWDGTTWNAPAPAPAPPDASIGELHGVSCPTTTVCTAVGYYFSFDTNVDVTQAQRFSGGRWTRDTPPDVPQLDDVSCPSAAVCVATTTDVVDDVPTPVAARRAADGTWSVTTLPDPKPAADYNALTGIACTSAAACTAVGNGGGLPFVERYTGGSWALERTVAPVGVFGSRFEGVSCATASACTAVGRYDTGSQGVALIQRYDGTSWTRQTVPSRGGEPFTDLADVSCPTTSTCVAVGSAADDASGFSVPRPLLLRANGSTWTTVPTPGPSGTEGSLDAVSCASATSCVAVGFAYGAGNGALTYVLRGSTWTARSVPVPSGVSGVELTGVSCVSATACHAVGYGSGPTGFVHLDVVWDGTVWSAGPAVGAVDAVSCTRATVCTAVGTAGAGDPDVVANRLSGGTWTPQPVPAPDGTAYLAGVSCVATTCTAVGTASTTLVARSVAGAAWQLEAAVKPAGAGGLHDVSCVDADRCVAVGTFGSRGVIEVRTG